MVCERRVAMKMRSCRSFLNVIFLASLGASACGGISPGEPAPLSAFSGGLSLVWQDDTALDPPTGDQLHVVVYLQQPSFPNCLRIADDVTATFAGVTLQTLERGSKRDGLDDECIAPAFAGSLPPEGLTGGDATLLVSDGATSKTMELPQLLSRPVDVAPAQALTSARPGDRIEFRWSEATRWAPRDSKDPLPFRTMAFLYNPRTQRGEHVDAETEGLQSTLTIPAALAGSYFLQLMGYPDLAVGRCEGVSVCGARGRVSRSWPVEIK